MLNTVTATRFYQGMRVGKTQPLLMGCERLDGTELEAVVKLSVKCERGPTALAIEAIVALLAQDLGMPIPEPLAVLVDPDVIDEDSFATIRADVLASCNPSFGSCKIASGFSVVTEGARFESSLLNQGAEIFAFDGAILNADRRVTNPNCQCDGYSFAIFDHEGALTGLDVLGTFVQPFPWVPGALAPMERGPGKHALHSALKGRTVDFDRFEAAWGSITDGRLATYKDSLPVEWLQQEGTVDGALMHLRNVRQHLPQLLNEVRRALQ